jgi:hypothetical protein
MTGSTMEAPTKVAQPSIAEQILAASDIELRAHEVPEWGGITVYIRKLSHAQGLQIIKFITADDADVNEVMLTMLIFALCDETGAPLFTEDHRDRLGEKSNHVIKRLFNEAQNFNAIGTDAEDALSGN